MSDIQTSGNEGRFTGSIEMTSGPNTEAQSQEPEKKVEGQEQPNKEGGEQQATDWEKRYKDAQAELTRLQQEKAAAGKPKEGTEEPPPPKEGEAEEGTAEGEQEEGQEGEAEEQDDEQSLEEQVAAKVDVPKYEAEFTASGKLSDESYAELAEKGFDRQDVDDFIAFRQAKGERITNELAATVGGAEAWTTIQEWAKEGMPGEDRQAFNDSMAEAVKKGDLAAAKLLTAGILQKYEEANGFAPSRSATDGPTGEGGDDTSGYGSKAQWQAEHRTEAYRNDPTERARVDAKLARSGWYKAQNGL